MCGRFSLYQISEFLTRFNVELDEPLEPRYNIAPGQMSPIITNDEPSKVTFASWGLIPFWSKDPKIAFKTINAKAETLEEKPAYRTAFKRHRCLIPADGFYEWKSTDQGKTPYRITLIDNSLFSFAGIFDIWKNHEGKEITSFSIITLPPNDLLVKIHDRMPAILRRENEKIWLQEESAEKLKEMLNPYPSSEMRAYEISKLVNSPSADTPDVIKPAGGQRKSTLLDF
jgi:putative SOS response-associated peptidase YedK